MSDNSINNQRNIFMSIGNFPVLNPDEVGAIEFDGKTGDVTYHTSIGTVKLIDTTNTKEQKKWPKEECLQRR